MFWPPKVAKICLLSVRRVAVGIIKIEQQTWRWLNRLVRLVGLGLGFFPFSFFLFFCLGGFLVQLFPSLSQRKGGLVEYCWLILLLFLFTLFGVGWIGGHECSRN